MKKLIYNLLALSLVVLGVQSCDIFDSTSSIRPTAQGNPYELIVVCEQPVWEGELGDSLRTILQEPVAWLNQEEARFDVIRIVPRAITNITKRHRNILNINIDPSFTEVKSMLNEDIEATPQIMVTVSGPDQKSITEYISEHRENLVTVFEQAERDRALKHTEKYNESFIGKTIQDKFGVSIDVPKGYMLADDLKDFIWVRYEYPEASQGFMIYTYPYNGSDVMSMESIITARNQHAMFIPGPVEGSYMTTSTAFTPEIHSVRINDRKWIETRGYWDVANDFMGGPFVSYTTVDQETKQIFVIDCYIYSPRHPKRNYLRGVEHLVHSIDFNPAQQTEQSASEELAAAEVDKIEE